MTDVIEKMVDIYRMRVETTHALSLLNNNNHSCNSPFSINRIDNNVQTITIKIYDQFIPG